MGKYEEAIKDINKVIKINKENSMAYSSRSYSYIQLEKYEEAWKDINKSIEIDNENPAAYFVRGVYYFKKNDNENSEKDFKKFLEFSPSPKVYWFELEMLNKLKSGKL